MIPFLLLLIIAVFAGLLLHGLHRKVIARIQLRPGPPIWQEILHTLKFSFKQTWIPRTASQVMYVAIVLIAVGIWVAALWVVATGASLLILFALYMLHKIVEHGTGLSSGSPYTKFGAIRSVMSAAAELPLLATVAIVYLFTGTLSIGEIAEWNTTHTPLLLLAFPAAVSLYLIILSKAHYGPFSVIEAKELISGYWTEHFGGWRAMLNIAMSLKTVVLLSAFVLLFIGAVPWWLMIILMIVLMISVSFVCASTPMLTPYQVVTIQTVWTLVVLLYGGCVWLVLGGIL
ncbi:NAD(P)H-quinone oxidoreductase subunit 1, chloroplastic [Methanocorpusculaceae archaeon Sp1]|uniref:NAD(P)H-quinone oxidoreductase subunit 1, chloroplastic n=1 Tax=Methanorbis furvi TaxID=3028299 RepID=A0AAE4MBF3_9EURY|nr:NAD(P)H-quinone oxidoreductase subunit 1, chloroplastic [Methanocorpusculaceae archaeon Sp1]MDV0441790.1 NAD(P)H-quinone oxidoreductase subunit 1, chloroplastic [Methanocorpusculaceae archaeon Ag1]